MRVARRRRREVALPRERIVDLVIAQTAGRAGQTGAPHDCLRQTSARAARDRLGDQRRREDAVLAADERADVPGSVRPPGAAT